jgi:hypothetical protein
MVDEVKKVEETAPITDASVSEKITKGEKLSDAEKEFVKGNPNTDIPTEEVPEEKTEEKVEVPAATEPETVEKVEEEKAPEPDKEPAKKDPQEILAERKALIETETQKPEGQQDLTKFSDVEVGLFWEMRKQQNRNKRLQEENDELRFEKLKGKLEKKEEKPVEDPLAGIEDDDLIDGKKLKEIVKNINKDQGPKPILTPQRVDNEMPLAKQRLEAKGIKDFDEVIGHAEYALYDDPEARQILRDAALSGENTAEKTYWLIKGSRKFPQIKRMIEADKPVVVKKEAPKVNVERAKKIEENSKKLKTTGPAGGGAADTAGSYTEQDLAAMSPSDFRKLPRETRDSILKKFGSTPNYSK